MTTVSRDFFDLGQSIDHLPAEQVEGEVSQLVTRNRGEPSLLATIVSLRQIKFDSNGKDDVIGLLNIVGQAIERIPQDEAQALLGRCTSEAILEAFPRVESHIEANRNIENLASQAAEFTDFIRDPHQQAAALFSISRAISSSRAANFVGGYGSRSPLFWDAAMYIEDAGKAASNEEDPELRARMLAVLAQQAVRNVETAKISGAIANRNMGSHFIQRMYEMSGYLFAEAMESASASLFEPGHTATDEVMYIPVDILERPVDPEAPSSVTAKMAHSLVNRLTVASS